MAIEYFQKQERVSSDDDQSCSGCWTALTDILSYKATALRNFKRKKDRIVSRRSLLGERPTIDRNPVKNLVPQI